jgi:DNA polymerase III epsilon subunit-like protein
VDARVTLDVYDVLGQRVAQLVNGTIAAGHHDAAFDASALSSGLYLYRLTAVGTDGVLFTKTEKMLLTK